MKSRLFYAIVVFSILLSACNLPSTPAIPSATTESGDLVKTIAAETVVAVIPPTNTPLPPTKTLTLTSTPLASPTVTLTPTPTSTATPTATPTPVVGKVNGAVCYLRGEAIPEMIAYFQETQTNTIVELPIAAGQMTYTVQLAPGTYYAYAWLPDFSRGGLYSNAVPCGLKSTCKDRTPLAFTVNIGDVITGIDLCDWVAGPFNVPYPPGKKPEETVGTIAGTITYPDGAPPQLYVVAFNMDTKYWYYWMTAAGNTYFSIPDLPPGVYHIVAYADNGEAGGYADSSHQLIDVVLYAGATVNVTINDWDGSFPANPVK